MKRATTLLSTLLCTLALCGQTGGEILSQMSNRLDAMGAYRIDYTIEIPTADRPSEGWCIVADGERYTIAVEELTQGSDGRTVWAINPLNKEITLDSPCPDSRNLFDNPTKAFDFAADLFEVELTETTAEGDWRIVLLPKDGVLDGIERVVVSVDKTTLLPTRLGYDMAGVGLWITIRSIGAYTPAPHDFEVPTQQAFPDYEVIDFR